MPWRYFSLCHESMFYGQDEQDILQALANMLAPLISEEGE